MTTLNILVILAYMGSTGCYFAYLFLQKERLYRAGYYLLLAGFCCHSALITIGFIKAGHIPVRNLHETLTFVGWAIAGVFLVVQYRFKLKILGVFAAPLIVLVMIVSSQVPQVAPMENKLFNSFWLNFHILSSFMASASFSMACGVGILYLLQERTIKNKSRGFFFKRLPSLQLLDSTGYGCIIAGFTLLTLGLITGLIYAKSVWGRFWSWDPKEVWAAITWLVYAVLLHERITVGWRGRKAAIMAIIGFAVLLFTFFGVNFFLKGHHGEFTRF